MNFNQYKSDLNDLLLALLNNYGTHSVFVKHILLHMLGSWPTAGHFCILGRMAQETSASLGGWLKSTAPNCMQFGAVLGLNGLQEHILELQRLGVSSRDSLAALDRRFPIHKLFSIKS